MTEYNMMVVMLGISLMHSAHSPKPTILPVTDMAISVSENLGHKAKKVMKEILINP